MSKIGLTLWWCLIMDKALAEAARKLYAENLFEIVRQSYCEANKDYLQKQIKIASKFPQKYIDKIYEMASNQTTREMPGGLIAIKINNMLKKDKVLDKNGKLHTITKSQVNRILKDKYGKPLGVRKVFYLDETAKKKD